MLYFRLLPLACLFIGQSISSDTEHPNQGHHLPSTLHFVCNGSHGGKTSSKCKASVAAYCTNLYCSAECPNHGVAVGSFPGTG
ncbi:uncharacterized protein RAG0_11852 [Rhynchosporium agropyri]|uniref:Uncharacterized protein n=1 Tax=Rhynchosporium agropyri TaxID=914238 RepID=A0A1E1L8K1_9HELO|nr:uncharacterized protein RAG0_11852 [Rhynchosporium agropyri]